MSLTSWALFIYYKLLKNLSQSLSFIFYFFCSLSLKFKFLFEASLLEILFLWNSFSKLRFLKFLLLLLLWVSVHELYIFVLFWSCASELFETFRIFLFLIKIMLIQHLNYLPQILNLTEDRREPWIQRRTKK